MSADKVPPRRVSGPHRFPVARLGIAVGLVAGLVVVVITWSTRSSRGGAPGPTVGDRGAAVPMAGAGWVQWLVALGILLFGVWLVRWLTRSRVFQAEAARGMELLGQGRPDDAASVFESLMQRFRWRVPLASLARTNLAIVNMRRGRLEEAMQGLQAAVDWMRFEQAIALYNLAICHGIRGDIAAARACLADLRKRSRGAETAVVGVAEAVVACRSGDAAQLVRDLAQHWDAIEATGVELVTRPLRVLRAFAMDTVGNGRSEDVAAVLAPIAGAPVGEFAWLARDWPEMRRFLERHGLTAFAT